MPRVGRPEQPLVINGPLSRLAGELRHLRGRAELTYSELKERTGLSDATLRAAAGGERLPTWKVTRAFVTACGGDESTIRTLWKDACHAAGRTVPSESPAEPPVPDPKEVTTAAHLVDMLNRLLAWADHPPLAELNRRAGGHNLLPPSTVSDMLRTRRLPRLELMLAFVQACGLDDDRAAGWEYTWAAIRSQKNGLPPADQEAPRLQPHRARPRLLVICLLSVVFALLALIALVVSHVINWPTFGAHYSPRSGAMPQICTKSGPVVFIVSGRENSAAPALTGTMSTAAWTAIKQGSPIGLVDLDGEPRLTMAGAFSRQPANSLALLAAERDYLLGLESAVKNTRADYPHADVLNALNVAGQAIRGACSYGGTIYLEDSGLQDIGPVDFSQAGMLSASPASVVSLLASAGELPRLNGMTVILTGLGDTVPPQHPLSSSQRDNLIAIWTAIAKAGGATSVQVDTTAPRGPTPGHVPPVSLVPTSTVPGWVPSDATYVFRDSGPVGFEPGSAAFRNQATATAALRPLARYLATNPTAKIKISGTTAHSGTLAYALALSATRAAAVKAFLVQMGAASSQIVTDGLGWQFPGYINDQGPNGSVLPGPAEQNRSVIVTRI